MVSPSQIKANERQLETLKIQQRRKPREGRARLINLREQELQNQREAQNVSSQLSQSRFNSLSEFNRAYNNIDPRVRRFLNTNPSKMQEEQNSAIRDIERTLRSYEERAKNQSDKSSRQAFNEGVKILNESLQRLKAGEIINIGAIKDAVKNVRSSTAKTLGDARKLGTFNLKAQSKANKELQAQRQKIIDNAKNRDFTVGELQKLGFSMKEISAIGDKKATVGQLLEKGFTQKQISDIGSIQAWSNLISNIKANATAQKDKFKDLPSGGFSSTSNTISPSRNGGIVRYINKILTPKRTDSQVIRGLKGVGVFGKESAESLIGVGVFVSNALYNPQKALKQFNEAKSFITSGGISSIGAEVGRQIQSRDSFEKTQGLLTILTAFTGVKTPVIKSKPRLKGASDFDVRIQPNQNRAVINIESKGITEANEDFSQKSKLFQDLKTGNVRGSIQTRIGTKSETINVNLKDEGSRYVDKANNLIIPKRNINFDKVKFQLKQIKQTKLTPDVKELRVLDGKISKVTAGQRLVEVKDIKGEIRGGKLEQITKTRTSKVDFIRELTKEGDKLKQALGLPKSVTAKRLLRTLRTKQLPNKVIESFLKAVGNDNKIILGLDKRIRIARALGLRKDTAYLKQFNPIFNILSGNGKKFISVEKLQKLDNSIRNIEKRIKNLQSKKATSKLFSQNPKSFQLKELRKKLEKLRGIRNSYLDNTNIGKVKDIENVITEAITVTGQIKGKKVEIIDDVFRSFNLGGTHFLKSSLSSRSKKLIDNTRKDLLGKGIISKTNMDQLFKIPQQISIPDINVRLKLIRELRLKGFLPKKISADSIKRLQDTKKELESKNRTRETTKVTTKQRVTGRTSKVAQESKTANRTINTVQRIRDEPIRTPKIPPKSIRAPPRRIRLPKLRKLPKTKQSRAGYIINVKEGNRIISQSITPLPRNRAINTGRRIVDNNIRASFEIVPRGRTNIKDVDTTILNNKFTSKKGKNPLVRVFVEKKKFRLDAKGEKKQIQKTKSTTKRKKSPRIKRKPAKKRSKR